MPTNGDIDIAIIAKVPADTQGKEVRQDHGKTAFKDLSAHEDRAVNHRICNQLGFFSVEHLVPSVGAIRVLSPRSEADSVSLSRGDLPVCALWQDLKASTEGCMLVGLVLVLAPSALRLSIASNGAVAVVLLPLR